MDFEIKDFSLFSFLQNSTHDAIFLNIIPSEKRLALFKCEYVTTLANLVCYLYIGMCNTEDNPGALFELLTQESRSIQK